MSTTFQLGLCAGLDVSEDRCADICLAFVRAGSVSTLHEVFGDKTLRVTRSGAQWLPPRLGNKYVDRVREVGSVQWGNGIELSFYFHGSHLLVPTPRRFFEARLDLPDTPLHGLVMSTGGHAACRPLWDRRQELENTGATSGDELSAINHLLQVLATGRSYRSVVRVWF
jgi:hypothetical protein